ncbi:hypothetical protein RhiirA4_417694 [Rhizophagus irregularis]|uniref:Uncharacterized protein n=1 Tax=Rhizophagus irregularis TaxID=588596 RepID=A0A2I1G7W2_9GLOM|nr:hypothetical protein RhiirA4_417694 [Rhizophagus irregularis]
MEFLKRIFCFPFNKTHSRNKNVIEENNKNEVVNKTNLSNLYDESNINSNNLNFEQYIYNNQEFENEPEIVYHPKSCYISRKFNYSAKLNEMLSQDELSNKIVIIDDKNDGISKELACVEIVIMTGTSPTTSRHHKSEGRDPKKKTSFLQSPSETITIERRKGTTFLSAQSYINLMEFLKRIFYFPFNKTHSRNKNVYDTNHEQYIYDNQPYENEPEIVYHPKSCYISRKFNYSAKLNETLSQDELSNKIVIIDDKNDDHDGISKELDELDELDDCII